MKKIIYIFTLIMAMLSPAFAGDITVDMLNKRDDGAKMVYSEDVSRVDVGDTITWLPTSKGHNVHIKAGPEGFDLPKRSKMNKEYSFTFEIPGIYYYECTPHKGMGMIALAVHVYRREWVFPVWLIFSSIKVKGQIKATGL